MTQRFAPGNPAALSYLAQLLAARGVDPAAARAVFNVEGASGGIGDQGHAFGPGQFNDAGGAWTGRYPGLTAQQKNQQAWSSAGLLELANRVAQVAAGQHGAQAVRSIVTRFERPADPQGEIARALAAYGGGGAPAGSGRQVLAAYPQVGGSSLPPPGANGISSLLGRLIASTNEQLGLGGSPRLASMLQAAWGTPGQGKPKGGPPPTGLFQTLPFRKGSPVPVAPLPNAPAGGAGGIVELLREGVGGPTHSTGPHIHAAFTDPRLELAAIAKAQQLGLHVGENPYVGDVVDPVHAKNSYHYRTFPGVYRGRKLGEAIDVSGPRAGAFYSYLAGLRA